MEDTSAVPGFKRHIQLCIICLAMKINILSLHDLPLDDHLYSKQEGPENIDPWGTPQKRGARKEAFPSITEKDLSSFSDD